MLYPAYASGIITGAALGDRFGRRRIFGIGFLIFTAASVACALSATPEQLIAARVVQGIGAAIVMPLSLTILTTAFPPEKRGTIVGIWGGIGGLAVASGPMVGGLITQTLGWHWIFWVNVPIGVIATMLVPQKLSESFGPRTRIDLAGVGLVSLGALSLVWGLVRAADTGWTEAMTLGALAVGVISLSAFLAWEARATDPMLPLRLFRSRPFLGANATGFLMIGSLSASAFLVAQYFQLGLGYSPMQTGLRLLPWTATPLVIAPLFGKLSDRIGRRPILSLGTLLQGVGVEWLAILASDHVNYSALVPPLILSGVGISMALPVMPTAALSAVPPSDIGKASGVNSTLQRFGSVFAVAVASAVFGAFGKLGAADTFLSGFRPALGVVGALALLASVTALAVTSGPLLRSDERRGRRAQEEIGADNAVIRKIKNDFMTQPENNDGNSAVQLTHVTRTYKRDEFEVRALDNVTLDIPRKSFVAIMGPSGSGKTTLLNLVAGIDHATSGRVAVGGEEISAMNEREIAAWRARHIGLVFQFYNLIPVLTAFENVELPLLLTNLNKAERKTHVEAALKAVGLADRMGHYPRQLSGGQEQRVAIARAIATDPTILVADEPTGDLDAKSAEEILNLLTELNRQFGKTIVMVTHDPRSERFVDTVYRLDKGIFIGAEQGGRTANPAHSTETAA
jgi:EmrB/QacA subfamily drug resistance transporter